MYGYLTSPILVLWALVLQALLHLASWFSPAAVDPLCVVQPRCLAALALVSRVWPLGVSSVALRPQSLALPAPTATCIAAWAHIDTLCLRPLALPAPASLSLLSWVPAAALRL